MIAWLAFLTAVIVLSLITAFEEKRFGLWLTPFTCVSGPFVIVVGLNLLVGHRMGFYTVRAEAILFWVGMSLIFWLGGQLATPIESSNCSRAKADFCEDTAFRKWYGLMRKVAFVAILASGFQLMQVLGQIGWQNIGTDSFSKAYGAGLLGHLALPGQLSAIFLAGNYFSSRRLSDLLFALTVLVLTLASQIKYHATVLMFGMLYFPILSGKLRLSLRWLLGMALGAYALFISAYMITFSGSGAVGVFTIGTLRALSAHFVSYLFSGPLGLSSLFSGGFRPVLSPQEVFAPPINIVRFLTGTQEYVNIIIPDFIPLSASGSTSNVVGLFGMVYKYLGMGWTIAYSGLLGWINYGLFSLGQRRNCLMSRVLSSLFLGYLTLGFFDLYFNKLDAWELPAIGGVLVLLRHLMRSVTVSLRRAHG